MLTEASDHALPPLPTFPRPPPLHTPSPKALLSVVCDGLRSCAPLVALEREWPLKPLPLPTWLRGSWTELGRLSTLQSELASPPFFVL